MSLAKKFVRTAVSFLLVGPMVDNRHLHTSTMISIKATQLLRVLQEEIIALLAS